VAACHDCSDGGLGITLAEMAFAGETGCDADLDAFPVDAPMRADHVLFSESNSRFVIEVAPGDVETVSTLLGDVPHAVVGGVTGSGRLTVTSGGGTVLDEDVSGLKAVWQAPLRKV